MSVETNEAMPSTSIDLQTLRSNLREVMENLHLLENGENVRVEDLIRETRENLDRNRLLILENIGQNQRDRRVANIRNENSVHGVHLEMLNPQQLQPDGQQPRRQNLVNTAGGEIDRDQRGNVEQNLRDNGGYDAVRRMEIRVREWAEKYERDVNFRQNRPNDTGNVPQNRPNVAPASNNPRLEHRRFVGNNVMNVALNRNINGNNDETVRRAFFPNAVGALGYRHDPVLNEVNAIPQREADLGDNMRALERREEPVAANPAPARRDNVANVGLGEATIRRHPARAPARDIADLEERIASLRERLDRLEDRRFHEATIEGRGQEETGHMITNLRQRLVRENVANPPANQNDNIARRNPPTADGNQECLRPLVLQPPRGSFFPLLPRAPNQTNNQRNPAVKRPIGDEDSGITSGAGDQKRIAKLSNVDENVPGRSLDPDSPQLNNENVIPGCSASSGISRILLIASDVAQSSSQNASENAPMEVLQNNDLKLSPEKAAKLKNFQNTLNDRRDAGPSRCRFESHINGNTELNNIENRRSNDRTVLDVIVGSDNNEQEAQIIPLNEENQQIGQQNLNDDVIIVSAYFPVRIKVERDDDEENAKNSRPNVMNAAPNLAEPPAIPQNLNVPRILRENGAEIRALPERIINYARAILRMNARTRRGPEFPVTADRLFLTPQNMAAGLQNFVSAEMTNFRRGNRLPRYVQDDQGEAIQLNMMEIYVRLRRELTEVVSNSELLGFRSHKVSTWGVHIIFVFNLVGPPVTAYDGAEIGVRIKINSRQVGRDDIEVCVNHRIWHPNMSPFTGKILPHFLWSNWTIFKILACIRRLLIIPELDNITHGVVARQYETNREVFRRTAQHWMSIYGHRRNGHLAIPEYTELLERLVEEGIPRDRALHLLSKNDWDIDGAMEEIG